MPSQRWLITEKLKNICLGVEMSIAFKRVRELFDYRDDGNLIWKVSNSNRAKIGHVAGTSYSNAYNQVSVDNAPYYTHRIIWLWHHGYLPEYDIDHINKDKCDNRIENLRETTRLCNLRNAKDHKNNKSGVKGVYRHKSWGKWQARIGLHRKAHSLGEYDSFDEAVLARLAAEQCLDWDGCDSTSPAYLYAVKNGLIYPILRY